MSLLRKGLVRMYHINEYGDEITFQLMPEHYVVANFDFIIQDKPSKYYFEALEKTSVFYADYKTIDDIASKYPKLESNRKFMLRKFLLEAKERLESFVLLTPEQRYVKYIEDFPDMYNRVPDKYIANVLGITPVSLSRIRKRISNK
jgi:CRP-like cAMP-binding protein